MPSKYISRTTEIGNITIVEIGKMEHMPSRISFEFNSDRDILISTLNNEVGCISYQIKGMKYTSIKYDIIYPGKVHRYPNSCIKNNRAVIIWTKLMIGQEM